ncbi:MAG: YcxB family protein [Clostridia bacterium]|nr:YcxB family protein [Clostridia bacterium]
MKVNFKNTTKYTKEAYEKFLAFHQKKYGPKYKIVTAIVIVLLIFCSIMNFKYGNALVGLLLFVGSIGFLLYRFKEPIRKITKERNSDKIKNEREFTFSFYDSYIKIIGNKINAKVRYWNLKKAFEDKDYIYLYIEDEHAFVLKKDGFSIGNCKEFMPFIKKKILFKI